MPKPLSGEQIADALIADTFDEPIHDDWKHRLLGDLTDLTPEQIAESAAMPQLLQIKVNPLTAYLASEVAANSLMSRRGWMTWLMIEAIAAEHPEIDKELLWKNAPNPRKLRRASPIGTLGSAGRRKRKREQQTDSESS